MHVVVGIDIGETNMERLRTRFPAVAFTLVRVSFGVGTSITIFAPC